MKLYTASPLFLTLPVELVENIAGWLSGDSFLNLRLVCRDLQKKTFHHFARRFFLSVTTDLSEKSLGRINALSHHSALSSQVQSLRFALRNGIGRDMVWDRHPWGPLSAPMEVEAVRRLRDNLINNLTACRSFFIICRYPEGSPDWDHFTVTDAMAVFFALMVDAHLPVASFHLIYTNKRAQTLVMDVRRVPKLLYRQPTFKSIWAKLENLSLEQYLTLGNFSLLLELVLSAPNLRTLLLNLGSHELAAEFMHELAEAASFSQLKSLALFRTSVTAADLCKILVNIRKSLSQLTLYHVCLAQDEHWTTVLDELNQDFVALQTISLYFLWANFPTRDRFFFPSVQSVCRLPELLREQLHILYSDDTQNSPVLGFEYSGSDIPQILGHLRSGIQC